MLHNGTARHTWEGVTFEHATWLRPMQGAGYVEQQSAACNVCPVNQKMEPGCGGGDIYAITPGNVVVSGGSDISFVNCTFRHLGAYAAAAAGGSQRVAWTGNVFHDVSAGALMLGELNSCGVTDPAEWDSNFTVSDNVIVDIPVEYSGATGIFLGYVDSTVVEHNLIANLTYSAMTIGWGWGRTGCRRGNNHIVANRIENPLQARCCDGGEVYTLGPQPGSTIERNHLVNHGKPPSKHSSYASYPNAVYHDNGSGGFKDMKNVIEGIWQHFCGLNLPGGPFGIGKKCPGREGEQEDCSILFEYNWLHMTEVQHEQCSHGGSVTGNVDVPLNASLPPDAAAVVAAAGPRYLH